MSLRRCGFFLTLLLFVSCSSLPSRARVGECYRNNWHAGLWRVSQVTEDQVTLIEIPQLAGALGTVKVVGPWYGGWVLDACPAQEKNWATPLPNKKKE